MTYTDVNLIAAFLKRDLTSNEQLTLSILIPSVMRWIDRTVGYTFLEVAETTRVYDGGESSIDIDPAYEITAVKSIDDAGEDNYTYTLTSEYLLEPLNETIKTEIRRRNGYFPIGESRIAVTGKFSGWDNGVPEDITMIATKIAADVLTMASSNASNVQSESLEGHSVTYSSGNEDSISQAALNDPTVTDVLKMYSGILLG